MSKRKGWVVVRWEPRLCCKVGSRKTAREVAKVLNKCKVQQEAVYEVRRNG